MKDLFKSIKFWETSFIILSAILISPLFIEFLLLTIIPLVVFSVIPSFLAFKKKKFSIILFNILILVGSLALYIYLW